MLKYSFQNKSSLTPKPMFDIQTDSVSSGHVLVMHFFTDCVFKMSQVFMVKAKNKS